MKKVIISIILIAIVVLACFALYNNMLERFAVAEDEINYEEYEGLYYYNQLTEEQKELYVRLDLGINELNPDIQLGFTTLEDASGNVRRALSALYNDRPEYYFLPDEYNIKTIDFIFAEYIHVQFYYEVSSGSEKIKKDKEFENAIQQLLEDVVTLDMTDIEKEIAIHDKLLEQVTYYEYKNIENIPREKHTAYGALVHKEAVCDGISKAMMILLKRVGIESVLAFGNVDETPHAWNVVKLDGEYYHLDATSDTININSKKYVMHNYFNITDEKLKTTHIIENEFEIPECAGEKYNYYTYNDYEVAYAESMKSKLKMIINKQANSSILELRIDQLYSTQNLLEALYFLDFNNWYTDGKTSVSYHNMDNVYIFENNAKKKIVD